MAGAVSSDQVAQAFVQACRAELSALKPGNVHIHAGGHGMEVATFEAAATAAAPHVGNTALKVGARVRRAVEASMAAAGCNTNLGILLLCVPLAAAAMQPDGSSLHARLRHVLASLDEDDAHDVYGAIRAANPGGLGASPQADVHVPPTIALIEAMALAAPRDRIAANYVSGFADIFEDHLPLLMHIKRRADETGASSSDNAVSALYMSLLARYRDSHIGRKFGAETAAYVQHLAQAVDPHWAPLVRPSSHAALMALDARLKTEGWNPGTTADFVVATLFAAKINTPFNH